MNDEDVENRIKDLFTPLYKVRLVEVTGFHQTRICFTTSHVDLQYQATLT
jgi:hypothetical protein